VHAGACDESIDGGDLLAGCEILENAARNPSAGLSTRWRSDFPNNKTLRRRGVGENFNRLLGEQLTCFSRLRKPPGGGLRVEELSVLAHFENSASPCHKGDRFSRRLFDLSRDTLGFRPVVSLRTIFNLNRHDPILIQIVPAGNDQPNTPSGTRPWSLLIRRSMPSWLQASLL
jgi:hypothetical protein